MIGLYFSGTGNTRHAVEAFVQMCDPNSTAVSIEDSAAMAQLAHHNTIVLGYPVHFSSIPKILQDFIVQNGPLFSGKTVFIIATMALFSGDGAGCAARLLTKHGATITGALHLKMPDNIGDEKVLKLTPAQNKAIIACAQNKLAKAAQQWQQRTPPHDGLSPLAHAAGLLGQRLWFIHKTKTYQSKPRINATVCTGCGRCTALCPTQNLALQHGKALSHSHCTLCYRCFSHCPARAIAILGRRVHVQYLLEHTL